MVLSDWTAVRSVESARVGQDLAFPGPESPWTGGALVEAVRDGRVPESAVDDKVLRLLRLAGRVGALDGFGGAPVTADLPDIDAVRRTAHEVALAGAVLLRNDGALPLPTGSTIALIGHSALTARTQGGGSAIVYAEHEISPADGLRAALGDRVSLSLGAIVHEDVRPFAPARMVGGTARCTFLAPDGTVVLEEQRATTQLAWFAPHVAQSERLRIAVDVLPDETGRIELALHLVGSAVVSIDGEVAWSGDLVGEGLDLGGNHRVPGTADIACPVDGEGPTRIVLDWTLPKGRGQFDEHAFLVLGERPDADGDELIAAAAEAARAADVAVVVVGTSARVESEGADRADLRLPGRQDELVEAVLAANPRTVVVVNSGAPVLMPWRERVAAVLLSWFGGQEMGHALADVLTGVREPGGRLPTTWPAVEDDLPVRDVTPIEGRLPYAEGIHLGHRAWLRSERVPAYAFGHGLGYTTWELVNVSLDIGGHGSPTVTASVRNTGERAGKQVVQVYAERADSAYERPVRWLVGFAAVEVGPGECATLRIPVTRRALEVRHDGGWVLEPGAFEFAVGFAADDLPWRGRAALS
ncbi:unannotated protein [freshwater metagenome]|uniref:Unannotated protein n=1 Tax=freshwater metagenome TaxID=449393 RepID=A0A6J6R1B4_9ZZZZ